MTDSIGLNRGMRPNSEMNAIGYAIAVLMLPLLIPLIPFFLAFWVVDWLTRQAGVEEDDEGWQRGQSGRQPRAD